MIYISRDLEIVLIIIFLLYGILYLWVLTIKNIQKFSSIISTSKSGMEIIYISVKCFRWKDKIQS